MKVISWDRLIQGADSVTEPVCITIGVFDGVHRGHQALIQEVTRDSSLKPLVVTFSNNPFAVLRPDVFRGYLQSLPMKLAQLDNLGVSGVVVIDFSPDFSKLTGENFLTLLRNSLNIRKLVLGSNHKFGQGEGMGPEEARRYCRENEIELVVVPALKMGETRVSSTRVRTAILEGRLREARELLGGPYVLDLNELNGESRHGSVRLAREKIPQILPPPGTYPVKLNQLKDGFATDLKLDHQWLEWNNPADMQVKKIFF